tara:strand:+ start:14 stop:361 length:348 start_codon:yes stop_codon:yes gene_type:complete
MSMALQNNSHSHFQSQNQSDGHSDGHTPHTRPSQYNSDIDDESYRSQQMSPLNSNSPTGSPHPNPKLRKSFNGTSASGELGEGVESVDVVDLVGRVSKGEAVSKLENRISDIGIG